MLVKSACYSCKILDYTDYISWGIGYGSISIGGSHNTYNNKNFISPINVSFKGANDLISNIADGTKSLSSRTMSAAQFIGKVSPMGQLDSSISFGNIYNISDSSDRSKGTDEFLTGEALTGTLMLPKIPIGIAATMSTDNLKSDLGNISKKPIGWEVVISSGKGFNLSRSNSIPVDSVVEYFMGDSDD